MLSSHLTTTSLLFNKWQTDAHRHYITSGITSVSAGLPHAVNAKVIGLSCTPPRTMDLGANEMFTWDNKLQSQDSFAQDLRLFKTAQTDSSTQTPVAVEGWTKADALEEAGVHFTPRTWLEYCTARPLYSSRPLILLARGSSVPHA